MAENGDFAGVRHGKFCDMPARREATVDVNLPHRRSFSPHAAFWTGGPLTARFPERAPIFAVEVRSEGDCGPAAERALAAKRADYFAAGTVVVWDIDLLDSQVVRVYRAAGPTNPTPYGRSEHAEAEPAFPDWSMRVDDLFSPRE